MRLRAREKALINRVQGATRTRVLRQRTLRGGWRDGPIMLVAEECGEAKTPSASSVVVDPRDIRW
jgi:hypothetical protein